MSGKAGMGSGNKTKALGLADKTARAVAMGLAAPALVYMAGATAALYADGVAGEKTRLLGATGAALWHIAFDQSADILRPETDSPEPARETTEGTPPFPGFIEISPRRQGVVLKDAQGNEIAAWTGEFRDIFPESEHMGGDVPDMYWRKARPLPDGDIVAVFSSPSRTPYGVGAARLRPDGEIVWRAARHIHHDVEIAPNGDVYALDMRIEQADANYGNARGQDIIEEGVVRLSPEGGIAVTVDFKDAFSKSPYAPMIKSSKHALSGDVLHANSIRRFGASASAFPFAEADDFLISFRAKDMLAVIDFADARVKWATTGPWDGQHGATPTEDGEIVLFDNNGELVDGVWKSRVMAYDPGNGRVRKLLGGGAIDSEVYGTVHRLADGGWMVVDSQQGRALALDGRNRETWRHALPRTPGENGKSLVWSLTDAIPVNAEFMEAVKRKVQK